MSTTIPDLWPSKIKIDVLPPIVILKVQEGLLASKTRGLLEAKLATVETESLVQHQLDLLAPSLNFYRERILSATHDRRMLYPVTVTARGFDSTHSPLHTNGAETVQRRAATEEEFLELVRQVLQSELVRALVCSLLARINEEKGEWQGNGKGEQEITQTSNETKGGT